MTIQLKEIEARTINVNWIEVICTTSEGVFVLKTDMARLANMDKESWAKRAIEGWFDHDVKIILKKNEKK